jgi:subtilisin family serine protease
MGSLKSRSRNVLPQDLDDQSGASVHLLNLDPLLQAAESDAEPQNEPWAADSLTGLTSLTPAASSRSSTATLQAPGNIDGVTGLPLAPAAGTSPTWTAPGGGTAVADDQLYIVFLDQADRDGPPGLAARVQRLLGGTSAQDLLEHLNGFTARLSPAQAKGLQRVPGVRSIEADRPVTLVQPVEVAAMTSAGGSTATVQTTPYGVGMAWGKTNYSTADNSKKYAFVIDTGISTTTNDLNTNSKYSKNFTSAKSTDWTDYNGHGTHVAGTIAAINDNDGVVGVAAGANVISLRVFDSNGFGQTSWTVNAINYAAGLAKTGALSTVAVSSLVANMSLGGGLNSSIDNAVRAAATPDSNGRYLRFAIAAGNSGDDVDNYSPANTGDAPNIYTVSAVDQSNTMASWSNYDNLGDTVDNCDFSLPGVDIVSLGMTAGTLVTMSGTSMACPHMAGILLMGTPLAGQLSTPVITVASGDPFASLS